VPQTAGNPPDTNFESGALSLSVTAPTVGALTVVSGNNQPAALAGATLQPLVAEVVDASSKPLVGQLLRGPQPQPAPSSSTMLRRSPIPMDWLRFRTRC